MQSFVVVETKTQKPAEVSEEGSRPASLRDFAYCPPLLMIITIIIFFFLKMDLVKFRLAQNSLCNQDKLDFLIFLLSVCGRDFMHLFSCRFTLWWGLNPELHAC